jgi:hypothetical protein
MFNIVYDVVNTNRIILMNDIIFKDNKKSTLSWNLLSLC